jgi:hypothetical protein
MDLRRRRRTRHKKHKHRKHGKKTRKTLQIKAPNTVLNFSPISSPGSFNNTLSPNTPFEEPNTPITRRAKELAALYPNRATMVARSKSFNSPGLGTENFYNEFERIFPNGNGVRYN